MDKDGTGQVEQKELHGALQRLGGNIKASDVDHLLANMDSDGDGQVKIERESY
jgi:Ca2+-binding EF-hand superfamily protein